jgi:hypothetical protein
VHSKGDTQRNPAAAIGELIIAFQELENALILVLAGLTDPTDDRVGIIVATQLSFRRIGMVTEAMLHHRTTSKELRQNFAGILKNSRRLEEERNKYVHSFYDWHEITNGGITYERLKDRIKSGKGFSPDYELLDTGKVVEICERLRILTAAIDLFFEQLQIGRVIPDRRGE